MILDATLDTRTICRRFGRTIRRRHTHALDAFRLDRLPGGGAEEKLSKLLADVVELLGAPGPGRLPSLSVLLENGVLRWSPYDLSVFGIYFGGSDYYYRGSREEAVREALSRHPAYLASESGTPDGRAVLFGYYSPGDGVFHVAREAFPLISERIDPAAGSGAWT